MKSMTCERSSAAIAAILALGFALLANPAYARGKPGGGSTPPPVPDIVYMSDDGKMAVWQAGVRGFTLGSDQAGGTDISLLGSRAGRVYTSVTWSPDGRRFAWIEITNSMRGSTASILAAAPGGKPVTLYSSTDGDGKPALLHNSDALAWGRNCDGSGSVLAFQSSSPYGIFALNFVGDNPAGAPVQLTDLGASQVEFGFAFSPTGQHLAFLGYGSGLGYGIALVPMCESDKTPVSVVSYVDLGVGGPTSFALTSLDWSRDGRWLAVSLVNDPVGWRDIKIVELYYSAAGGQEQVTGHGPISLLDFTSLFGSASSEHSPSWGPITSSTCQRLAFSRSTDAGRSLYLLDIPVVAGATCELTTPRLISSKAPRALDWK